MRYVRLVNSEWTLVASGRPYFTLIITGECYRTKLTKRPAHLSRSCYPGHIIIRPWPRQWSPVPRTFVRILWTEHRLPIILFNLRSFSVPCCICKECRYACYPHNFERWFYIITIAVYMAFRFLSGVSAAALLCVAGGSVVDIFDDASVSKCVQIFHLRRKCDIHR